MTFNTKRTYPFYDIENELRIKEAIHQYLTDLCAIIAYKAVLLDCSCPFDIHDEPFRPGWLSITKVHHKFFAHMRPFQTKHEHDNLLASSMITEPITMV